MYFAIYITKLSTTPISEWHRRLFYALPFDAGVFRKVLKFSVPRRRQLFLLSILLACRRHPHPSAIIEKLGPPQSFYKNYWLVYLLY